MSVPKKTSSASKKKKSGGDKAKPRTVSRMASVQALYQMDLAGTDAGDVIEQFMVVRIEPVEGEPDADVKRDPLTSLEGADTTFFAEVVKGVVRRQREIDPLVDQQLRTGWRLVRVDSILRAILRAGVFELMERSDVPARVTINEYINIAKAFFEADEPKVVNGVLDRIAHKIRAKEFDAPSEGD
jgi:N utilization substance protein B